MLPPAGTQPAGPTGSSTGAVSGTPGSTDGSAATGAPVTATPDATGTANDASAGDGAMATDPAGGEMPAAGDDTGAMAGGSAGAPAPVPEDPADEGFLPWCVDNPSQVVIVGDSYINWGTHTLPADLAAESGQQWRLYAVGGASMASGGATGFIPDQLELAIAQDPEIRTVVMDGGGNDILIPNALFAGSQDCKNDPNAGQVEVCRMIVDLALEASEKMMMRAADIGVRDTVYFYYPEVPEGTALGGSNPNAILNYALPLAREQCESAFELTGGRMRCHFVDMIPVFEGQSNVFAPGDIHPNSNGSALMAEAIWQTMVDNCVAQPASSGCCEP
jgi:hypothetical protein